MINTDPELIEFVQLFASAALFSAGLLALVEVVRFILHPERRAISNKPRGTEAPNELD